MSLVFLSQPNLLAQRGNLVSVEMGNALEQGILEVEITGAYNPHIYYETFDRSGMHYGKCMIMTISSKIDTLVLLRLSAGIEVIPEDTSFQTMIVTKEGLIPLHPNATYRTLFYAMCGQIQDSPPDMNASFTLGDLTQPDVVRLAQYLDTNDIQNIIGQHALWAATDNVGFKELEKYGADSISINKTIEILRDLKLSTALSGDYIQPEAKQDVISFPKDLAYIGFGALGLAFALLAIGLVKRNNTSV
jgi:hypothetical protein